MRVDVAALDPPSQGKHRWEGAPRAMLEIKWCGDTLPSASDVLWDLARLASIALRHPDVDCYFALLGVRSKIDLFFEGIGATRTLKGREGPFLRQSVVNPFRVLTLNQLSPGLRTKVMGKLSPYAAGLNPFTGGGGIYQLNTVRHDAGPAEPRVETKPRIGMTAIVSLIRVQKR